MTDLPDNQEIFDRAAVGTTLQGHLTQGTYVSTRQEQTTGHPCRCAVGHASGCVLGDWEVPTIAILLLWRRETDNLCTLLVDINDESLDLDEWRERMARATLDLGLDDSLLWATEVCDRVVERLGDEEPLSGKWWG